MILKLMRRHVKSSEVHVKAVTDIEIYASTNKVLWCLEKFGNYRRPFSLIISNNVMA